MDSHHQPNRGLMHEQLRYPLNWAHPVSFGLALMHHSRSLSAAAVHHWWKALMLTWCGQSEMCGGAKITREIRILFRILITTRPINQWVRWQTRGLKRI